MRRKGNVTCFASDPDMLARFLLVHNVGMATLAGLVPGKGHGASCYLANGVTTIMPVLPKAARDNCRAQDHKGGERNRHHHGQPNQVLYVFEQVRLPRNEIPITIALNGTFEPVAKR